MQRQSFNARDGFSASGLIQRASLGGDVGIARGSVGASSLGGPVDLNHTTPGQTLPGAGNGIIRQGGAVGGAGAGAYKSALDYIARAEGTAGQAGGGYNTSLGYGKFLPGGREQNLTGKKLNEILALGYYMRKQPGNPNSSALGRYQIVGKTLRGLMGKLGLSGNEKFDEAMQDHLGAELIRQRGASAQGLGNEWASLKGAKGQEAARIVAGIPSGSSTTPGARTASLGNPVTGAGDVIGRIGELSRSGAINGRECVDLVKAYTGQRGSVTTWRRGENADGGNLTPGTPIATFLNRDGSQANRYAGGGTGTPGANLDHAGIFESYIRDKAGQAIGMRIAEQYRRSGGPRMKEYFFGQGRGEGNGSNYAAVLGPDGNPLGGKVRRATGADGVQSPGYAQDEDISDGFRSSGWKEKTAGASQNVPTPIQKNGGALNMGGSSSKVSAPITINGVNKDHQELAREIQRHVEDVQGSRTHDVDYQTT